MSATTGGRAYAKSGLHDLFPTQRNDVGDNGPNLPITEGRPGGHRGATYAVADDEKNFPGESWVRPWRQLEVRGWRNHPLPSLATAVPI